MNKINIVRVGSKRPVSMNARAADALVRSGRFSYVDTPQTKVSRAKYQARTTDAARSSQTVQKTTKAQEDSLEEKTKEQLIDLLESYGEKVDRRLGRDSLLDQAQRYHRRDMRAE